jgi:asparagine synthase (glutamine-hydrolysing)
VSDADVGLQADARRLQNALMGACVRVLRRQDAVCVATSGGLDSSVLAAMLVQHADVPVQLLTVGVSGAADPQRARNLARHLRLPLMEIVLTPSRVQRILSDLVPLVGPSRVDPARAAEWGIDAQTEYVSPLRTSWELPIFAVAQEAWRFAPRLVVGQGADEWLLGYSKYTELVGDALQRQVVVDRRVLEEEVLPIEKRIADHAGVLLQYPYLNEAVRGVCGRLPIEHLLHQGVRKRVLREVARGLDLPASVVDVPKTAAQYGSGVSEILKQLAADAGQHQNEYLTSFLAQRRIGELHSLRT